MYFPTDPTTLPFCGTDLDVILSTISSVYENINPEGFIIRGDINCDFSHTTGFVQKLKDFVVENHLCIMWNNLSVDYTYIHTDKESSSTIDLFLVNGAIINLCTVGGVNHIYSDGIFHSPAFIHLDIGSMPVYIQDRHNFIPKVAWYKASQCDIDT